MADLRTNFLGVKSPNPFWLASAPPTDRKVNVERAFRAGWGGVVWKTLGEAGPPIVNVSGARYGAIHGPDRRLIAMNNIELITDRDLEINLQEIKEVKRAWRDRALIVSLMVPCDEELLEGYSRPRRRDRLRRSRAQFRLPARHVGTRHGLGGRPGSRICRNGRALVQGAHPHAGHRQADAQHNRHQESRAGGAERRRRRGVAHQHDQLDHGRSISIAMAPAVAIDGKGTHGGMCGPAVKPIALAMVSEIARDRECAGLPISAIGGITTWRDAAEFIALGAGTVQVCTAAMTYGFKIVEEMTSGLAAYMDSKATRRSRTSADARSPRSPTGSISISITSSRPRSIRFSASSAAGATSSARTPRTRRFSPM